MNIVRIIHRFFFAEISATGFGLMRIAWALTAFFWFAFQYNDIPFLYGLVESLNPIDQAHILFRAEHRFTLLELFPELSSHYILYALLLTSLLSSALGIIPRISTITATILMFSFHERDLSILGGGDTVLRHIAFVLCVSPNISACSMQRLYKHWKHFKKTKQLLPPLTTPIWAYRLLLWQFIAIYVFSLLNKLDGTMWHNGTAFATTIHHTHFSRLSGELAHVVAYFSPIICFSVLTFEVLWGMLLLPKSWGSLLPKWFPRFSLKRIALLGGVFFHGGIYVTMVVGSFPAAMLTGYLGLLDGDDFHAMQHWCNKRMTGKIVILNDYTCRLCRRSAFLFTILDWLGRIQTVDYHDVKIKKKYAPTIPKRELDHSMHIVTTGKKKTVVKGFYAFRYLCWHLPALWIVAPFLHIPGIPAMGERVYSYVAANRKKCIDGACSI